MVSDAAVRTSVANLVTSRPLVAVFFAGATGIGHYTLRELARATADHPGAKGFRAYVVARRENVAREVIAECGALIRDGVSDVAVVDDVTGGGGGGGDGVEGDAGAGSKATAEFVFVQTSDLSLMGEVDRVCARITELETARAGRAGDVARIDYLLFTQGCVVYQPRKDTEEGLDFTMSILYYSRMRALTQLLPLLLAASRSSSSASSSSPPAEQQPDNHATVVSVFAAGTEDTLHAENLALDNPVSDYTYNTARSHMNYMHTLFFEQLARDPPEPGRPTPTGSGKGLTLVHVFPGLVNGPGFQSSEMPSWFRVLWSWVVVPLLGWAAFTKAEVCGRRILSLTDAQRYPPSSSSSSSSSPPTGSNAAGGGSVEEGVVRSTTGETGPGGGTYALGSSIDDTFNSAKYAGLDRAAMREAVWRHTMDAFDTIAAGKVFTGAKQAAQ
ncbi:uncharacterized protein B0I36DRAFT_162745 [Microdochium trichocladiopsis]|uniref:Uncharacterized protein n=1 Tax=Microdochium trichocladiopsis TaxID=1682393 RepID=A0A9P8XXA0_9PEZI|nr:uncharacterized protein B0I36DRAFT_162745 [Microdochium trichocladiopsis]KAH7024528.1 hypothetical protein B0I36DRAFT_162745 [Microdochium trichocladiopsis]